jgi:uncharacterized membrane protein YcaP (DUF421 family)
MIIDTIIAGLVGFVALIGILRINGLRTFSKMSSYDFAITLASGSLLATIVAGSVSIARGIVALAVLFSIQSATSYLRKRFDFSQVVDNTPLLLMDQDGYIEENLAATDVTKEDIAAKLREANVLHASEIVAVILESTGDVSVLHGDSQQVEPEVMAGVRLRQAGDLVGK